MKKAIVVLLCGLLALGAHAGMSSVAKVKESNNNMLTARNAVLNDL